MSLSLRYFLKMMKNTLLIILFLIPISLSSQNHEVNINYRIGGATNELSRISPRADYSPGYINMQSIYDQGITFDYKYQIWKKIGLFVYGGFEVSNSKHYFKIIEYPRRHLANVIIRQNRYAFKFGLNKQVKLYDGKILLDIGVHFVDRYYMSKSQKYSQELTQSYLSWKYYSYDLETFYGEYYLNHGGVENKGYMYLNLEYTLNLKFKLKKQLYFNFGLNYSRNNIFFYNYSYTILSTYQGGGTSYFNDLGVQEPSKFAVRDHFLYLSLGFSYKFNWKQKK